MKKSSLLSYALALLLVAQAKASLYEISFAEILGGPTTATGQIDVVGGFAVSGYLDITGGSTLGLYDFIPASGTVGGTTVSGSTLYVSPSAFFLTDSVVLVGSNPFLTEGGLLFAAAGIEINLFFIDGSYFLYGREVGTRRFDPAAEGTATLTAVPEAGTTLAMMGAALLGLATLRRRFHCR